MATISFDELKKAVDSLREAYEFSQDASLSLTQKKIYRDACIQRYEYSIELSWKLAKKKMGSTQVTSRPVIREMAQNGYVQDPQVWFSFLEATNKTSHAYDEEIAKAVFSSIPGFLTEVEKLMTHLNNDKK